MEVMIKILEESVKKNGEKPLTNKWLLNILKLAKARVEKEDYGADIGDGYDWYDKD